MKDESILMTDHWQEELKSLPIIASVSNLSKILILCLEKRAYDSIAENEVEGDPQPQAKKDI